MPLTGKRILLIISGGIAAYKSLDLIRRLRERGCTVRTILTKAGQHFVTPLSVAAIAHEKVYTDIFSLTDESEMGHLRLAEDADLVVVAPATADILAKMAAGIADELATTALLATDRPILVAPAMNVRMWRHAATAENMTMLERRGVKRVGPNDGPLAEGESGPGRMAEPLEIVAAVSDLFGSDRPLANRHAIVTSGPTHEAIDPVRYIANRSSGKQGHAIAAALARFGAKVTLVSGPTALADPAGVTTIHVESARDMLAACRAALPADIAVCAAAVADWRPAQPAREKIKKGMSHAAPAIDLTENPDILKTISQAGPGRPGLVVGFAAETQRLLAHAKAKLRSKGCDWIVANDVSAAAGTLGGNANAITLITAKAAEKWPKLDKTEVANRLAQRIARHMAPPERPDASRPPSRRRPRRR